MVWENVQAIRHTDRHLGTTGLWLNIYSPIASDSAGQQVTLATVAKILDHHAPHHTFSILAGDWNASLIPREGAACTKNADERFRKWWAQHALVTVSSKNYTYLSVTDRNHQSTIDYIFLCAKMAGVSTTSTTVESMDPFHDHRLLKCYIQGIPCSLELYLA